MTLAVDRICITEPGTYNGTTVSMSPAVPVIIGTQRIPGFTSTDGVHASSVITVQFDQPIDFISVSIVGSQSPGNLLICYDSEGNIVAQTSFNFDPTQVYFKDTQQINVPNIVRVQLIPDGFSYVYYESLCFVQQQITVQQRPGGAQPSVIIIPVQVNIFARPLPQTISIPVSLTINPAIPKFAHLPISTNVTLKINPILLPLKAAIQNSFRALTSGTIANFYDDERVLKTLINFGNDSQALITNWQYDPADSSQTTILVKLYEPLLTSILEKSQVWISREIAPSQIDQIVVSRELAPPSLVYLRPANRNIKVQGLFGSSVNNVTLQNLFPTGSATVSASAIILTDPVLEKYYTTALDGAELNLDYTDYNNFVKFGSAISRLNAFKNKMLLLENYTALMKTQSTAVSSSGISNITGSAQYSYMISLAQQRQNLLRSFDDYEQFLYYGTGSVYSSSLSSLNEDTIYYHSQANWPKQSGSVFSVASASNGNLYHASILIPSANLTDTSWFGKQSYIAAQYDLQNMDSLSNTIPLYLQEDANSTDYISFLNLIGYHFDRIKPYIDRMTDIYSRDSNPNEGLSKDLIWNVAQSLGIDIPNQYAIQNIVNYLVGSGSLPSKIYKDVVSETWKRFIHNQVFIAKSKGTYTSLQTLLNTYGIRPEIIQIRESITPSSLFVTQSYEVINQLTNTLNFNRGSTVTIPWSINGIFGGELYKTVQVRFASSGSSSQIQTLFTGGNAWAVLLVPTGSSGSNQGYVSLATTFPGSNISSSVFPLFNGDYYNIMVRANGTPGVAASPTALDMTVKKYTGDTVSYFFNGASSGAAGFWLSPSTLIVGSSSYAPGLTTGFVGTIDEIRGSGEYITDSVFDDFCRYPGLYYGNTTGSANTQLFFRLSFGVPVNLTTTSFIPNESPYVSASNNAFVAFATASGFTSQSTYPYNVSKIYRTVSRYAANAGGNQFSSNKIYIAPSPTLKLLTMDNGTQVPVLNRNQSIVSIATKKDSVISSNTVGFYFTLTDAINDSMVRSLGRIDLSSLIGDPSYIYRHEYPALQTLNMYYWSHYAYTFNLNTFIRFVQNLLGSVFDQASNLIPIRTKLLTGMVIEPHILERSKLPNYKPSINGLNARANQTASSTVSAWNLDAFLTASVLPTGSANLIFNDAYINAAFTGSITGNTLFYDALIQQYSQSAIFAENDTFSSSISVGAASGSLSASALWFDAFITSSRIASVSNSAVISIDDYTETVKFTSYWLAQNNVSSIGQLSSTAFGTLNSFIPGTRIQAFNSYATMSAYIPPSSQSFFMPVIYPISDFSPLNPGAFEYFTNVSGAFGRKTYINVRIGQEVLNNRGTWTASLAYKKNDFVIQQGVTNAASGGNGKEFVCVTDQVLSPAGTPVGFVSTIPPYFDSRNWLPMSYTRVLVPQILEVSASSSATGLVQLVGYNVANKPFTGYASNHYKFYKDNRTAVRRQKYLGCQNTIDTTIDGKSPVEIFPSSQAQLVVNKAGQPIQKSTDNTGPILDVK